MIAWFEQLIGLVVLVGGAFLFGLTLGGVVNE
ncbi:Protein of unknown function [Leuconostoc citreum]|nr:Protein of unknown function [Leuconostoc citreum]